MELYGHGSLILLDGLVPVYTSAHSFELVIKFVISDLQACHISHGNRLEGVEVGLLVNSGHDFLWRNEVVGLLEPGDAVVESLLGRFCYRLGRCGSQLVLLCFFGSLALRFLFFLMCD